MATMSLRRIDIVPTHQAQDSSVPTITYNGNGNTSGKVPVDNKNYPAGTKAIVLGNTGALVKNSAKFASWNTSANGSGTVYHPKDDITLNANTTLYAQWYITKGLTGGGTTTHYQFAYDSSLAAAGGPEPARTNSVIAKCEADFTKMKGWFGGIKLTYSYPVSILVANRGGGAGWGPPITLKGGGNNADFLRDLIVAEVTEMFMLAQGAGWFALDKSNEGSTGEGLSHFLNQEFEIGDGRPPGLAFNAGLWLNSSRYDYVNNNLEHDHSNSPASGCSVLFLWYLATQLGYSVDEIVQAGAHTLGQVYRKLTGHHIDPFPYFKLLLDNAFPPTAVSVVAGPNRDNPFPLALLSFWVDKSTFGHAEVQDVLNTHAGRFSNAFWLVIEGLSPHVFNSLTVTFPAFTGTFAAIPGVSITRGTAPVDFEDPAQPKRQQRIRIAFDITFSNASLASFPAAGKPPNVLDLEGSLAIKGNTPPGATAVTIFELVAGADPYFTNIDPTQDNVFWRSQDLRVFTATPGMEDHPVPNGPAFGTDSVAGAYSYIQDLLAHLNSTYTDPSGVDPFVSAIPGQGTALSESSSVSPLTIAWHFPHLDLYHNYNFAIARVRLRGLAGTTAKQIKVFFRLWSTMTVDTDFDPNTTYRSTKVGGLPVAPLSGSDHRTLPFFATGDLNTNTDYDVGGTNNQDIPLDIGDRRWAYFGCFLNFFDPNHTFDGKPVQTLLNGTHHCLVAELASGDAPITNSAAVTLSPENCDKLAQRNLQFTVSDNPGGAASHRIPQTFDIRPSQAIPPTAIAGSPESYPDELMIDWGQTPVGSKVHIYWPQVAATEVLALATRLYGNPSLTAADAHTIECTVTRGVCYVPIPPGSAESFAGLFTVDLPTTVVAGQEFNIVVRRVSTWRRSGGLKTHRVLRVNAGTDDPVEPEQPAPPARDRRITKAQVRTWRYVTGSFEIKIPVGTPETILGPEQSTLAIMKWRLQQMSPSRRWYPVLQRYITYLGGRVRELGGDPDSIPPSAKGYWEAPPSSGSGPEQVFSGRITEVVYGCDGRMEGFVLRACCDEVHRLRACGRGLEPLILQACTQGYQVTVLAGDDSSVRKLIIRG